MSTGTLIRFNVSVPMKVNPQSRHLYLWMLVDYMPTFDQVPLQEAKLKTATGKTAQITKEYLDFIEQLTEGQAGRLQPSEGESLATVRRRLGVAAKLSDKDITIKRQGNEVYFWVEPNPRLRRQIRRSRSAPEA